MNAGVIKMSESILDSLLEPIMDQLRRTAGKVIDTISEAVIIGTNEVVYNVSQKISASIYAILFSGAGAIIVLIGIAQLIDFFTKINGVGLTVSGICLFLLGAHFNPMLSQLGTLSRIFS